MFPTSIKYCKPTVCAEMAFVATWGTCSTSAYVTKACHPSASPLRTINAFAIWARLLAAARSRASTFVSAAVDILPSVKLMSIFAYVVRVWLLGAVLVTMAWWVLMLMTASVIVETLPCAGRSTTHASVVQAQLCNVEQATICTIASVVMRRRAQRNVGDAGL